MFRKSLFSTFTLGFKKKVFEIQIQVFQFVNLKIQMQTLHKCIEISLNTITHAFDPISDL